MSFCRILFFIFVIFFSECFCLFIFFPQAIFKCVPNSYLRNACMWIHSNKCWQRSKVEGWIVPLQLLSFCFSCTFLFFFGWFTIISIATSIIRAVTVILFIKRSSALLLFNLLIKKVKLIMLSIFLMYFNMKMLTFSLCDNII